MREAEIYLTKIDVPLVPGINILFCEKGEKTPFDGLSTDPRISEGYRVSISSRRDGPIVYSLKAFMEGKHVLGFFENTTYQWFVHSESGQSEEADPHRQLLSLSSSLKDNPKSFWTEQYIGANTPQGEFMVRNYLGSSWLRLNGTDHKLFFDIFSRKLDFFTEYKAMVEDIAEYCSQLLQQFCSPTSLSFSPDSERDPRTVLEKFLFLRHTLSPDKVTWVMELIGRMPHVQLEKKQFWDFSVNSQSTDLFVDPMNHGRDWVKKGSITGESPFNPLQVLNTLKSENYDTPPNRFVKFAMTEFRSICDQVIEEFGDEKNYGVASLEAKAMSYELDQTLNEKFWDGVNAMERMPLDNITLQRREGYRQILLAWLITEMASQLDWPGRVDAYDGTSRDVPQIYEYWLFFKLLAILKELGFKIVLPRDTTPCSGSDLPFFLKPQKGRMLLNLKKGQVSLVVLERKDEKTNKDIRLHLYYNRRFQVTEYELGRNLAGSYSRIYQPDFTLAILEKQFENDNPIEAEKKAFELGRATILHFDAKYRVEDISDLFISTGPDEEENADSSHQIKLDYKVDDISKMHTYNDAIRRTAGSYVIYPGTYGNSEIFRRYHEIIPGVGAFSLKPNSERNEEENEALKVFIKDVIRVHLEEESFFSRSNRLSLDLENGLR